MKTPVQINLLAILSAILLHVLIYFFLIFYMRHLSTPIMTADHLKENHAINLYFYAAEKKISSSHPVANSRPKHSATQFPQHFVAHNDGDNNLIATLHAAISAQQKYPSQALALRQEGESLVGFDLQMNGEITNVRLIQSSGFESIDVASLEAVKQASPVTLTQDDINFMLENSTHFELKVAFHLQ